MSVKALTPPQLFDSLTVIVGPPAKSQAIKTQYGARHEFCQFFGTAGDPNPLNYEQGIPHVLRLMNSRQFMGSSLDALVTRAGSPSRSSDEVIHNLFLAILARRPTPPEHLLAQDHLKAAPDPHAGCRQVAWALLMSSEFLLNR